MDDVQVLYPKERITLYGINSNCELFLPIARSSFPSYFPFCFCSLLLQRRAVAALLSPGEVHGVVLCIALVFLSFLRFLLYSVDWTSVGHSLRCGSLGLETSTLNSIVLRLLLGALQKYYITPESESERWFMIYDHRPPPSSKELNRSDGIGNFYPREMSISTSVV